MLSRLSVSCELVFIVARYMVFLLPLRTWLPSREFARRLARRFWPTIFLRKMQRWSSCCAKRERLSLAKRGPMNLPMVPFVHQRAIRGIIIALQAVPVAARRQPLPRGCAWARLGVIRVARFVFRRHAVALRVL